jgi:cysteinyl-tRNA synthetase
MASIGWAAAFGMASAASAQAPVAPVTAPQPVVPGETASARERLKGVARWGYQLQKVDAEAIAASPFDLVVIDYSRNGVDAGRWRPGEVQRMQARPDGGRRLVLAYLSIGEAEDYRFYWNKAWVGPVPAMREPGKPPSGEAAMPETVRIPRLIAPGWLGHENEVWRGSFHVRFWHEAWQEIIMHGNESYLARIVDAGFDGVYLDRIDGYYALRNDEPYAGNWMVNFVVELGEIARARRTGFLVVAQNAEELVGDARYLAAIDGIAKEDLLYGAAGDGTRNTDARIGKSMSNLMIAKGAGKAVLAVEYITDEAWRRSVEAELQSRGIVPYTGPRLLDRLALPPSAEMPAATPAPAATAPAGAATGEARP